tara:strand:+ start:378 stop:626 length:249 start_codon:yes stop_codon:yes gene_type:complete
MTDDAMLANIATLVEGVLGAGPVTLTTETRADEVEGWDSLSHLDIICAVEEHYAIRFGVADIVDIENLGMMCSAIRSRLAAK